MRTRFLIVALVVAASAGCVGGDTDSASVATSNDAGAGLSESPAEGGALDLDQVSRDERQVITTADLTLTTRDVEGAGAKSIEIVESSGGFVESEEADLSGAPRITLVLKVPPEEYRATLEAIEALGDVTQRREHIEDVTQQVVDLESRIDTARVSTQRLRELLVGRGSLQDIVTLERELSQREADLESLLAVRQAIARQVDNATITLHLSRPPKTASAGEPSEKIPGFLRGLKTGWGAFVNVVLGIVTVAGFLLPFAVAGGLLSLIALPVSRRIRKSRGSRRDWGASGPEISAVDDRDHGE